MIEVVERTPDGTRYRCNGIALDRDIDGAQLVVDVEATVSGRDFRVDLAVQNQDSAQPGHPVTLTAEEIEIVDQTMTYEMNRQADSQLSRDPDEAAAHAEADAEEHRHHRWLREGS